MMIEHGADNYIYIYDEWNPARDKLYKYMHRLKYYYTY